MLVAIGSCAIFGIPQLRSAHRPSGPLGLPPKLQRLVDHGHEVPTTCPLVVLVCGATGYLGGYVCTAAKKAGYTVHILSRRPSDQLPPTLLEVVDHVFVGQATEPETLDGLCRGVDIVFSCLGNRTLT